MSQAGPSWSCQISIQWEYERDGTRSQQIREVPFGPCMTEKTDVELTLRRAQAAVLNPDGDTESFLSMPATELGQVRTTQLNYSKTTICIRLSAPTLTDLVLIDLPGRHNLFCKYSSVLMKLSGLTENPQVEDAQLVRDMVLGPY